MTESDQFYIFALQSKNAVWANMKHSRYFHLTSNFWSIHTHGKKGDVQTFGIVEIPLVMEEH